MENKLYRCFRVYEEEGVFLPKIELQPLSKLHQPDNVLVRVSYSSLNYKDALSTSGHKGITRKFPHTPGIDAVGEVAEIGKSNFSKGQKVLVTSYDLGMNTPGGFSEFISVPAAWVVPLPEGMTELQSMILGTAGFTAALALHKMEQSGQKPSMGKILVTGATGAVGSLSLALLKKCGYQSIASSGKTDKHDYLKSLGANEIIDRAAVNDDSKKPFLSVRWAGAIDTIGGNTLETILKSTGHNANVAVCGLVASPNFNTTVYPFIIKGNNLLGVESAECDYELRVKLWGKLAMEWSIDFPSNAVDVCSLDDLSSRIQKMLQSKLYGRVVVKI
jgi:putative YhdH/YhfP family quinone oxidoreductase